MDSGLRSVEQVLGREIFVRIGTALTELATDWLRDRGMQVAMVETGGDPGHAPARRTYEKAAYTLLPVARYFRAL